MEDVIKIHSTVNKHQSEGCYCYLRRNLYHSQILRLHWEIVDHNEISHVLTGKSHGHTEIFLAMGKSSCRYLEKYCDHKERFHDKSVRFGDQPERPFANQRDHLVTQEYFILAQMEVIAFLRDFSG